MLSHRKKAAFRSALLDSILSKFMKWFVNKTPTTILLVVLLFIRQILPISLSPYDSKTMYLRSLIVARNEPILVKTSFVHMTN